MLKKISLILLIIVVVGGAIFLFVQDGSATKDHELKTVEAFKGTIVDKALAVGRIEPKREVAVKSKIGGIVRKIYVEVGDQVTVGDPLFDIAPDPTPLEYAEASRQVELAQVTFDNQKREFDRIKTLRDKELISAQEFEAKRAAYEEAELRLKLAKEKLALIESGHARLADRTVENVIRSNTSGMVLSIDVEEGDPVVPLTSFQAGTELMKLADMKDLIFRGNVDEIDVGKLRVGMPAEIEIGALPNEKIKGALERISPRAHKEEGATLFEVEIAIADTGSSFLRAGYSANADIIIKRKKDILLVPERLVTITDSVNTVELMDSLGQIDTAAIETGLSDGINIEVVSGLQEGDKLVERPPREITAD